MSVPSPSDVPTPAGGSAPLSTSPAAARSSQPEFDIPYDFVSELPKSVGQQRWEAFVNKNKQNPFIGLGAFFVAREGGKLDGAEQRIGKRGGRARPKEPFPMLTPPFPALARLLSLMLLLSTGCLATIGALVGAIRSMRAGNQRQMQLFFRARVASVFSFSPSSCLSELAKLILILS